jgi:hypothetical protein
MRNLLSQFGHARKPNFVDVPSKLPFSRNLPQTLKNENPNNNSLEITVMPTVALQGLRKLELTQQRVARIDNFDTLRDNTAKSSGLSFPQKVQTFREERKV